MQFRLLGPLEVDVAGDRVDISAARDRVLLAMLLLDPNRVVTLPRLVDAVWGEHAPATARAQLHTCVSRLRRHLPGTIHTETAGYRAVVADNDLDTLVFANLIAEGRAALAGGELRAAQKHLRGALDLWRGPALAGVDSPSVQSVAMALEERRSATLEDCIDVELQLGLEAELVSQLTGLVEQHPLRERLTGQLMTALAKIGRTADALAVFRRLHRALDDEQGLAPSIELQELHRRLLDPGQGGHQPPGEPFPLRAALPVPAPWSLPRDVADFSGREEIVRDLVEAAQRAPAGAPVILTIDGMAGVGKTSLAVHVAHRVAQLFPDGRLFLDLRAHSNRPPLPPHEAIGLLLGNLGLDQARIPADPDERVARWRSELAHRRMLVVLDNADDTKQVTPLLPGSSAGLVIVTSRRRLAGLDAVRPVALDVLSQDEAMRLLTRTVGVRAARDPAAASQVARLCGHLPLALRLAAARLTHRPTWTVADLVDRLERAEPAPVELEVEGRSAAAAFALSYRQLAGPAQRLFRLLGLHPAGELGVRVAASLADVSVVTADDMLEQLVDAHLLSEPVAGRFRLHDLLRDYAARLVDADAERDDATRRMLDFYLQSTAEATADTEMRRRRGPIDFTDIGPNVPRFTNQAAAKRWLDLECANVIGVAHISDRLGWHRHTCLFPRALWSYLFRYSMNDVSIDLHNRALHAAEALQDRSLLSMTHNFVASAYARKGNMTEALRHLKPALDDPAYAVQARANLASVYVQTGRFAEALRDHETTMSPMSDSWRDSNQAISMILALRHLGRYDEAIQMTRRAINGGRRLRNAWFAGTAAAELAVLRQRRGQHRQAARLLRWALSTFDGSAGLGAELEARSYLGLSLLALGDTEAALELLHQAYQHGAQADATLACLTGNNLGEALAAVGRTDEAKLVHAQVLERALRIEQRYEQARAYRGLGVCDLNRDTRLAGDRLAVALSMFEQLGTPERHQVADLLAALRGRDGPRGK